MLIDLFFEILQECKGMKPTKLLVSKLYITCTYIVSYYIIIYYYILLYWIWHCSCDRIMCIYHILCYVRCDEILRNLKYKYKLFFVKYFFIKFTIIKKYIILIYSKYFKTMIINHFIRCIIITYLKYYIILELLFSHITISD